MTKDGFVIDMTKRFPGTDPAVIGRADTLSDVAIHLSERAPLTAEEARELVEAFYGDVDLSAMRAA